MTKNGYFLSKLATEPSKLSPGRDPVGARISVGCPRLVGKLRASSLDVGSKDEQQHGVGKDD